KLEKDFEALFLNFEDIDRALEWCEDRLIMASSPGWLVNHPVKQAEYELFKGLSSEEIKVLAGRLTRQSFSAGEAIIRTGEEASELYFLAMGTVRVIVPTEDGNTKRLATFSPGMAFGEMAILDGAPRSAMIVADSNVECDLLTVDDFENLSVTNPGIKIRLLHNLSLSLSHKLRKANRQLSVLE